MTRSGQMMISDAATPPSKLTRKLRLRLRMRMRMRLRRLEESKA